MPFSPPRLSVPRNTGNRRPPAPPISMKSTCELLTQMDDLGALSGGSATTDGAPEPVSCAGACTEDHPMGPLEGIRLLEIAGIGPGPYCAMVLADMGAEVVRVVRPGPSPFGNSPKHDLLSRGRRSICVDLKRPEGTDTVLRLCERADGLFEGFRPGVMERLGL